MGATESFRGTAWSLPCAQVCLTLSSCRSMKLAMPSGMRSNRMKAKKKPKPQADKNYISVTAKIFAVLEYFIQEGARQQSISFQELYGALPFARTTVHRILYSLEKLGYVEKAEVRAHYHLGPKFF